MAHLVLGMGMSHSIMVTLDDSLLGERAAQDAAFAILFDKVRFRLLLFNGEGMLIERFGLPIISFQVFEMVFNLKALDKAVLWA